MITIYDQNGKEVAMFQGHSNLNIATSLSF